MNEIQDNEEAIEHTPLRNLPYSGLIVHKYDEWEQGDPTRPNNVLISNIDELSTVSLVGRNINTGEMVYASSSNDVREVIHQLRDFIDFLKNFEE